MMWEVLTRKLPFRSLDEASIIARVKVGGRPEIPLDLTGIPPGYVEVSLIDLSLL